MEITRLGSAMGAEVGGLDLARPLDEGTAHDLYKALVEHRVLLVRAPGLTPEQHMALGRALGEIEVHAFFPNLGEGYEQVSVLDSEQGATAAMWHTDESFLPHPPMATLTQARILPTVGGDTLFASTTAAYAGLSAPMKRYLEGLTALHDLSRVTELRWRFGGATDEAYGAAIAAGRHHAHPIVRPHPETGELGLFVNPTYTRHVVGLPPDESEVLLGHLFRHSVKEQFTWRHQWTEGDVLIWDNRSLMHLALNDFTGRRLMHRVSVVGTHER